jgi:hypothetical protein
MPRGIGGTRQKLSARMTGQELTPAELPEVLGLARVGAVLIEGV